MKTTIRQLLARESLAKSVCYALFSAMKDAHLSQQAAVLALLAAKGESIHEIMAARDCLLEHSTLDLRTLNQCPDNMIDLVGTGGDGLGTFNISTAASLIVASCNVPVAKHGGGSITSLSGSADVIEQLNIPCCKTSEDIVEQMNKHGFAYLNAAYFNPMFQVFKPIRATLGFPTIFNILGPLSNPLQPKRQVIGVYRKALVPIVAHVLKETGSIHALVVHAKEGMDELSVSGETYVAEVRFGEKIKEYLFCPSILNLPKYNLKDVSGGTAKENAQTIRDILSQTRLGAKRDVVLLNAAAGLYVADKVSTIAEGMHMALDAVTSGKALHLLDTLKQGV